jgi:LPXTG-motif cell wall-anchored protein
MLRRIAAIATALFLAAIGVLTGAAATQAADFYLTAADLSTPESSPYPAGWFHGNVSGTMGVPTSTADGLTVTGGDYQLLNGTPGAVALTATGAGLATNGDFVFQISLIAGPTDTFTTLRATPAGIAGDQWTTSEDLTALGGAGFEANSTHALAEYVTAFGDVYTVLAFGAFTHGDGSSLASLTWNGNTYFFTPAQVAVVDPALPVTGANATLPLVAAGILLLAGGLAIFASHRRESNAV